MTTRSRGVSILWQWKRQKGKLVQIVSKLNEDMMNYEIKLTPPVYICENTVRPLF